MKCAICKQLGVWSQRFGMILCNACKRRLEQTGGKGMIIKLANGKTIEIADVVEDPKAEATRWLQQYKESPGRDPGSSTTPIDTERSLCNGKNSTTD